MTITPTPSPIVAAAPTINIGAIDADLIRVDGFGVNITSLGTPVEGAIKWLRFIDVNTIKQGASIHLPGGVDLHVKNETVVGFAAFSPELWRCISLVQ